MKKREHAEERFEWLLRQRGFEYWTEEKLERVVEVKGKHPDFYIRDLGGRCALAEIKSFDKTRKQFSSGRTGAVSVDLMLGAVRKALKIASEQLNPYQDLKIPMVVVLDNWRQLNIDLSPLILSSLLGELGIHMQVDMSTGQAFDVHWKPGNNQMLRVDEKSYISAVGVNRRISPDYSQEPPMSESAMYLTILHNPFAQVPLPVNFFQGKGDRNYVIQDGQPVLSGPSD